MAKERINEEEGNWHGQDNNIRQVASRNEHGIKQYHIGGKIEK